MNTPRESLPSLEDAFREIQSRLHDLSDEELVQALFDDFLRREANGQAPHHSIYLERFPAAGDQLERYFEVHLAVSHGDLADLVDTLSPQAANESIDLILDDYRVVREIARGGMGIVYEAEQLSLGRRVALKTLHRIASIDKRRRQRFLNEAQAASTLKIDGIVPVTSVGEEKGIYYFAMPFIDGADLGQVMAYLKRRPTACESDACESDKQGKQGSSDKTIQSVAVAAGLDDVGTKDYYRAAARLGATLGAALDQAHQVGIIHRDVKPTNILLDKSGEPWISDFGLAQLESSETLTRSGDILGTYHYMSPEQAAGNAARVDCRSDVYSLGATLYELLTLEFPFAEYKPTRLIKAVLEDEPVPPRKRIPGIPRELETVVLKAMAKKSADRYDTAQAMADDLSRVVNRKPILARKAGVLDRCGHWLRRRRKLAAAAVGILVLVTSAAFTALQYHAVKLGELNHRLSQERLELAKLLYANNVRSAYEALDRNDTAKVVEVVKQQEAGPVVAVTTGIEWRLLKKISSQYEPLLVLKGHEGPVTELAAVPGKPWVVSVGEDLTARIWDVEKGEQLAQYVSDDGVLSAVAVSPDGRYFATGCRNLRLFELVSCKLVRTITTHQRTTESIAFSPSGSEIASGSRYDRIHLNSLDGRLIASVNSGARNEMLIFTGDGHRLVGSAREEPDKYEFIRVWNTTDQMAMKFRDIKPELYPNFRFFVQSSDDRWLGAGGPNSGQLDFFDSTNGMLLHSISRQGDRHLSALAKTVDDQHCAAAFADGSIRYWKLQPKVASAWTVPGSEHKFLAHDGQVNSLCFLPNGQLVSCGRDGFIKVWPKMNRRFLFAGQHQSLWWTMDIAVNDRIALVTYSPPKCVIRCGRIDRDKWIQSDLPTSVGAVQFNPAGTLLAAGGEGRVYLLDAGTLRIVNAMEHLNDDGSVHAIGGLAFSHDGKWMATGGGDVVHLRNAQTLESLNDWNLQCTCLAFSPDAQSLACGDRNGRTSIIQTDTGTVTRELAAMSKITCLSWPPGLDLIVTGHADGKIVVWEVASGTRRYVLNEHTAPITALTLSPDDRTLFSCAGDATARMWHLDTGLPMGILYREKHETNLPIAGLRFVKASKSIVIARCDPAEDQNLIVWPWE